MWRAEEGGPGADGDVREAQEEPRSGPGGLGEAPGGTPPQPTA